jgi:integrase
MLPDTRFRNAKAKDKIYKIADGKGLYLEIKPGGCKTWRYRFRQANGKETIATFGQYPEVTAEEARERHRAARKLRGQGISPVQHKRAQKAAQKAEEANSFKAVALQYIAESGKGWSEAYRKQILYNLERSVFPVIGDMSLKVISPGVLRDLLKSIPAITAARHARIWIGSVFKYALDEELCDSDPTASVSRLAALKHTSAHHRPLSKAELPELLRAVNACTSGVMVKLYVQIIARVFTRKQELAEAEWSEFDFEAGLWRIPAARMKARREHLVPLSSQVIGLLKKLELFSDGKHLFPGRDGRTIGATTINKVIRSLGFKGFSTHGFRGTASTMLHELGYPEAHIEIQLAHQIGNATARAYNAAQYLQQRREMMQAWSDYIDSLMAGANVVTSHSKKGAA